uniref:CC domain-containing protein n=1 Tax=Parastrongyloides trichosuri TaxID=131310 RepID=A0A0N4ZHS2_PARTI
MLFKITFLISSCLLSQTIAEIQPFLYISPNASINPIKEFITIDESNDSIRVKRQSVYYICGVYPNQYYSTSPCSQSVNKCTNGGLPLGLGCTRASDCLNTFVGVSTCINGCCCTVPTTIPTPDNNYYYCYTGEPSNLRCSAKNQCAAGKNCMNGLCCTVNPNEVQYACGGSGSIGLCSAQGTCGAGFHCTPGNYCCECPVGKSGGRCNNGQCAVGFTCQANGYCCASCPGNVTPYGACYNGQCGGNKQCCAGNICC